MWEKRDALTGGLVDADTEFEIQEWNPEKGQYEKSTYYQVVRRDDGKYTVHLIGDAFLKDGRASKACSTTIRPTRASIGSSS